MRHKVYGKKLGRNKDERDVLFKSLVHNLFSYGSIETTETKAKAVKGLIDKIITLAKSERSSSSGKNSQRLIQGYFNNRALEERLIKDLLPKMQNRVSGYTSLIRIGRRLGDNTMVVKMSLIGAGKLEPIKKQPKNQVKPEENKKAVSGEKVESVGKPKLKQPIKRRLSKTK